MEQICVSIHKIRDAVRQEDKLFLLNNLLSNDLFLKDFSFGNFLL